MMEENNLVVKNPLATAKNETRQLKNKLMEKNGHKSGKSFKRVMKEAKRLQKAGL
jgi:hypothetical protein